jgi:hypothetical protein
MVMTYLANGLVLVALVAPGTAVHTFTGDQTGERFGWAVSELSDIDRDGAREAIVGAPRHRKAAGQVTGHADVYSGRTGKRIHRFEGEPEDRLGYSMADAGDVDGDRADLVGNQPRAQLTRDLLRRLGDPTQPVAEPATVAYLRFATAVHIDQIALRGLEHHLSAVIQRVPNELRHRANPLVASLQCRSTLNQLRR